MKPVILALSLVMLSFACGVEETTPPTAISVTLTPHAANAHIGESVQFTATVRNSTNKAVIWSLSGAGCSGSTCGTISITGLYAAPASVPSPATVTVRATSAADSSKSASATIIVLEAAINEWTWVSGSDLGNQGGVYGTKGMADPSNVPGARELAVSCVDAASKFWLFGGWGADSAGNGGDLNDLWKYDPETLMWTWMSGDSVRDQIGVYGTKGTADPSNVPGAREMATIWLDSNDKLWLFGGSGLDAAGDQGWLNDLWKYDPTTLEWTWMSGSNTVFQAGVYGTKGTADPSNVPGARDRAVSCTDSSGRLWLFGGEGLDSVGYYNDLNDLWRYDPVTLEWTWVSGSNNGEQSGIYGTKGMANPSNVPGGREMPVLRIDSSDNLWLFGGMGIDSVGYSGYLNDLWKFAPATLQWTWVSGSNTAYQAGIYGTKGTADPSNVPGARALAVFWIDSLGEFWLFGGEGEISGSAGGKLNDLWNYDPNTFEWTWVSGSDTTYQPGVYGIKGIADPSNVPGSRYGAVSWIDSGSNLWLFGGAGIDSTHHEGLLNDLWRYFR